jgi:hypothetical protein
MHYVARAICPRGLANRPWNFPRTECEEWRVGDAMRARRHEARQERNEKYFFKPGFLTLGMSALRDKADIRCQLAEVR